MLIGDCAAVRHRRPSPWYSRTSRRRGRRRSTTYNNGAITNETHIPGDRSFRTSGEGRGGGAPSACNTYSWYGDEESNDNAVLDDVAATGWTVTREPASRSDAVRHAAVDGMALLRDHADRVIGTRSMQGQLDQLGTGDRAGCGRRAQHGVDGDRGRELPGAPISRWRRRRGASRCAVGCRRGSRTTRVYRRRDGELVRTTATCR